jgi:DNA-binding transcriptional LysR family regulator
MANVEMQAFVQVVERGSFAGAATLLGLTPSAVSKLVSKLEDRLGVRLLHRTTRRLALTSEGDVYFARSRQILADIEEVEAEVAKLRAAPRGHLHVNTSNGFAIHQLVQALPDFLARYPDIQLELSVTDRIVDLVTERADVVIRTGPIVDTTLTARKIADFQRTLCASPAYLKRLVLRARPRILPITPALSFPYQPPSAGPFVRLMVWPTPRSHRA